MLCVLFVLFASVSMAEQEINYPNNLDKKHWNSLVMGLKTSHAHLFVPIENAAYNLYHQPFVHFDGDKSFVGVRGKNGTKHGLHIMPNQLSQLEKRTLRDTEDPDHPNGYEPNHDKLQDLWVEDQDNNVIFYVNLVKFKEAKAEFTVPKGAKTLTPYIMCDLHGIFIGPTYTLDLERKVSKLMKTVKKNVKEGPSSFHPAGKPVKHTPYMSLKKSREGSHHRVSAGVMGQGASTKRKHPQTPEHFVQVMYLKDHHEKIIHYQTFDPKESSDPAELVDIELPMEVRYVQAYEYCNLHGLWETSRLFIQTPETARDAVLAHKKKLSRQAKKEL